MAGKICAAFGCNNYQKDGNRLSFFRFPRNKDRCLRWLVNCRRADLDHFFRKSPAYLYENCRLCSCHFEDSQFLNPRLRNKLVSDAVPTIFQVPNPPPRLQSTRPARKLVKLNVETVGDDVAAVEEVACHSAVQLQSATRSDHTYCTSLAVSLEQSATDAVGSMTNQSQTSKRRHLTAKERTAKKTISRQRVTICRLKTRLRKLEHSNAPIFRGVHCDRLSAFFARQAALSSCNKFGHRFSARDKRFALSLYFAGPKAYSFCHQFFVLPSKRTLQMWISQLNIKPGFSESILSLLSKKVSTMTDNNKQCVLLLDEMSLKMNVSYDAAKDAIIGFENLGSGKEPANSALVFMIKGLCSKWKQPIGFFWSHNAASADNLKRLVSTAVEKLTAIGLSVCAVICDQGSTNQQMFRLFGITSDKPVAELHCKQVVFMFDPPHLLKSLRNNLFKHDFLINGKRVSWKYVRQFYEFDSSLKIRMAPKLTNQHIELPPFASMRVTLAAQVMSRTVAAAISTYVVLGKMPDAATATAEFLEMADGLFDCFNSRNLYDSKFLRRPLNDASQLSHWPHLDECTRQLQLLKVLDTKRTPPCIAGWLLSMNALKLLWSSLHVDQGISFILTSRLNQDSLENFFSLIRGRGGHRDNPDPIHFQSAFKQMAVQNLFKPASTANCTDDSADFLLQVDDFALSHTELDANGVLAELNDNSSRNVTILNARAGLILLGEEFEVIESISNASACEQNTLMYITGYVCKKVLDRHNCVKCRDTMLRKDTTFLNKTDIFCTHKAYNTSRGNFGGLKAPSPVMYDLMRTCEDTFNFLFDTVKCMPHIKRRLVNAVWNDMMELTTDATKPCLESQQRAVDLYMSTRLHYKLKFVNRQNRALTKNRRKKNRKAMKVMHQ